jgi:hypothetical protein
VIAVRVYENATTDSDERVSEAIFRSLAFEPSQSARGWKLDALSVQRLGIINPNELSSHVLAASVVAVDWLPEQ